jgi:hypothetical protein
LWKILAAKPARGHTKSESHHKFGGTGGQVDLQAPLRKLAVEYAVMPTAQGKSPDHDTCDRLDARDQLEAGDQISRARADWDSRLVAAGDGKPEVPSCRSDEQLDLFGFPVEAGNLRLPTAANLAADPMGGKPEADEPRDRARTGGPGMPEVGAPPRPGRPDNEELRRLEASVRWLLSESGVRRLPRAANLSPPGLPAQAADLGMSGLRVDVTPRPVPGSAHADGGEGTPLGADPYAQDPYAQDPDGSLQRRSLPPRSVRRTTSGLRNLLIASVFAAPTAYFIAKTHALPGLDLAAAALDSLEARAVALLPAPRPSRSELARMPQPAAAPSQPNDIADARTADAPPVPAEPQPPDAVSPPVDVPPESPSDGTSPAATAAADAATADTAPPTEASSRPAPALSAQDIALLIARGRAFFEAGDVASARLLFRRAANAGDAAAALAMGATYDPAVLADRLVRGMGAHMGADLEQARNWYEKARELGSPEGPRRLEMLAHR